MRTLFTWFLVLIVYRSMALELAGSYNELVTTLSLEDMDNILRYCLLDAKLIRLLSLNSRPRPLLSLESKDPSMRPLIDFASMFKCLSPFHERTLEIFLKQNGVTSSSMLTNNRTWLLFPINRLQSTEYGRAFIFKLLDWHPRSVHIPVSLWDPSEFSISQRRLLLDHVVKHQMDLIDSFDWCRLLAADVDDLVDLFRDFSSHDRWMLLTRDCMLVAKSVPFLSEAMSQLFLDESESTSLSNSPVEAVFRRTPIHRSTATTTQMSDWIHTAMTVYISQIRHQAAIKLSSVVAAAAAQVAKSAAATKRGKKKENWRLVSSFGSVSLAIQQANSSSSRRQFERCRPTASGSSAGQRPNPQIASNQRRNAYSGSPRHIIEAPRPIGMSRQQPSSAANSAESSNIRMSRSTRLALQRTPAILDADALADRSDLHLNLSALSPPAERYVDSPRYPTSLADHFSTSPLWLSYNDGPVDFSPSVSIAARPPSSNEEKIQADAQQESTALRNWRSRSVDHPEGDHTIGSRQWTVQSLPRLLRLLLSNKLNWPHHRRMMAALDIMSMAFDANLPFEKSWDIFFQIVPDPTQVPPFYCQCVTEAVHSLNTMPDTWQAFLYNHQSTHVNRSRWSQRQHLHTWRLRVTRMTDGIHQNLSFYHHQSLIHDCRRAMRGPIVGIVTNFRIHRSPTSAKPPINPLAALVRHYETMISNQRIVRVVDSRSEAVLDTSIRNSGAIPEVDVSSDDDSVPDAMLAPPLLRRQNAHVQSMEEEAQAAELESTDEFSPNTFVVGGRSLPIDVLDLALRRQPSGRWQESLHRRSSDVSQESNAVSAASDDDSELERSVPLGSALSYAGRLQPLSIRRPAMIFDANAFVDLSRIPASSGMARRESIFDSESAGGSPFQNDTMNRLASADQATSDPTTENQVSNSQTSDQTNGQTNGQTSDQTMGLSRTVGQVASTNSRPFAPIEGEGTSTVDPHAPLLDQELTPDLVYSDRDWMSAQETKCDAATRPISRWPYRLQFDCSREPRNDEMHTFLVSLIMAIGVGLLDPSVIPAPVYSFIYDRFASYSKRSRNKHTDQQTYQEAVDALCIQQTPLSTSAPSQRSLHGTVAHQTDFGSLKDSRVDSKWFVDICDRIYRTMNHFGMEFCLRHPPDHYSTWTFDRVSDDL